MKQPAPIRSVEALRLEKKRLLLEREQAKLGLLGVRARLSRRAYVKPALGLAAQVAEEGDLWMALADVAAQAAPKRWRHWARLLPLAAQHIWPIYRRWRGGSRIEP